MFVLLGFAVVAVPAYAAFSWIVSSTVIQLGTLFAEKQVLYDRYRGLETLMREVSLAETLAGSQAVRDWALHEDDPLYKQRGLAELEHYRRSFADRSYFFVIGASGNYYFNDAANAFAGNQLRYRVEANNPRDAWYFATSALGNGCHLNVDNDAHLQLTKVWMNCVIREGDRVLGVLGTGIDLSAFIQEVVNVPQLGVSTMFVDRRGAIQAHRDESLVDLRSLSDTEDQKRSVFALLDAPGDQLALRGLLDEVANGHNLVKSEFMSIGGKRMLVGVGYLDKLGWFNVTLMDVDSIIDRRLFAPIGLLLAAMMALVAVVMVLVFKRQLLDRLTRLEEVVRAARAGDYWPALSMGDTRQDEIGRLSAAFTEMAVTVSEHTQSLERRVRERTQELEELAFRDGQTGLANRRGFMAAFGAGSQDPERALLLIDIDHFKRVNDSFGHAAGDVVVREVAQRITDAIGPSNICARWGGDEFIVLLGSSTPQLLRMATQAIAGNIVERAIDLGDGQSVDITCSLGACRVEPGDSIEMAIEMADTALYMAKDGGRNRTVIFDSESHGLVPSQGALG
ncbi:sensor domain-containing diguanylate cyclase [Devosia sp. FKR38]|uniref:GGDEF domain-containing protein n=1 Tax=Devosia sp. FKR38 TaxID=2562312 RepID=UPI0020BFE59D|nr:sensor domain-containing diguanylate cyclase [Devosia sp. FKR38]